MCELCVSVDCVICVCVSMCMFACISYRRSLLGLWLFERKRLMTESAKATVACA